MNSSERPAAQPCIVLRFNHFDPIWRRCWDRPFTDDGRRFASYRAIEERWISDAIATCDDGVSCFMVECSWVLRHYLERHPEHMDVVRRLAREGRFELLGSGENIVDANMIHGETLVRNLVLGTLWAEDVLGRRPTTGWHSDGFGSSAQMPQLFRQCGYDWLPAISYRNPDAPYWRGLDGSTLFFFAEAGRQASDSDPQRLVHRQATASYIYVKLPPCPACAGEGCDACNGNGFDIVRAEFTAPPTERLPGEVVILLLTGEEIMPGLNVAADIAAFNAAHPEFAVRQGVYADLRPLLADYLSRVDAPPAHQISSKVENNPCHTGCYVSRIRIKQGHRALEHALLAAECWDALLAAGTAKETLREAWRKMTLSGFHDAITSSHCDPAYDELRDLHRDLAQTIAAVKSAACTTAPSTVPATATVFNHTQAAASAPVRVAIPSGWQGATVSADGVRVPVYDCTPGTVEFLATDVPGLGARTFAIAEEPFRTEALNERTIACGQLTVEVGEHGLTGIALAGVGRVADARKLLVGELVLEHDDGDPWATRSLDRHREPLASCTHLRSVERRGDSFVITYEGRHPASDNLHYCDDPHVLVLAWQQRFRLRAGLPWLEVETDVEWYTHSRRLRLAFPSSTTQDRGIYEVPHGTLTRDRYEGTSNHGGNAGGDWPAIHWAGIQATDHTFAVFNQGTPSYRIEDGVVMVSVLRSPQLPYCLLEPGSYVAYNYEGMADHGSHCFRHALYFGPGDWRDNDATRLAALFNSGLTACPGSLTAPLPQWMFAARHTQLAAVKTAEDGRGIILRLVEIAGRAETIAVRPPPAYTYARLTNLLEDDGEALAPSEGGYKIDMKPWQMVTVRLLPDNG
ncbi:MAG TPA: glycoside hydrolase family 38 C-terminal domain-containing protein [Planctomycetota bacterium]|nr:glycoside hydrolase family 38 C-terminal domain-containing protein [Planctomycetota bacterium]